MNHPTLMYFLRLSPRILLSVFVLFVSTTTPAQTVPAPANSVQTASGIFENGRVRPPTASSLRRQPGTPGTAEPAQSFSPESTSSNNHEQFDGKPVASIEFKGNRFLTDQKLYSSIQTRINRSFDSAIIKEDVRRLYRTGLIRDVRLLTQTSRQGLHLTFEVFERPTIGTVRYIGNRMFLDNKLTKQTNLHGGDALDIFTIEDAKRKIEELYHEKGFPKAHVTILEGNKPNQRNVVFYIDEGPREKIKLIEVVGNDPRLATDARLKTLLQAKDKLTNWIYGGDFIPAAVDADIEKLISYYRNLGYFQATAGRQIEYDKTGHWVTLRFIVNEGVRYRISSVSVQGNQRVNASILNPLVTINNGDYFHQGDLRIILESLNEVYGKMGYIYSTITPDIRFKETPGELDIIFQIDEGEQFTVGRIDAHISGIAPHTKNSVVLNRLSLIPGDLANDQEVQASERRLRFSSLFNADATRGTPPSIVIRSDEIQTRETSNATPSEQPTSETFRGQSPRIPSQIYNPVNRTSAFPLRYPAGK